MNKKIFILLFFLIVLISMSAVSAADLDDNNQAVVSSDIGVEKLSVSNDVNSIDDLNEDNDKLALSGTDVLGTDNGNYSGLSEEIAKAGNVKLSYKNYVYDDSTDTIEITEDNKVIDGNGAVIDMAGSTIRAFTVSASGVTIKNLTIKNVNFKGGDALGGAIFFSKSGIVENCTFVNNTAQYGGAVYWISGATVSNCTFTNNTANADGGAFYVRYGNTTVTNCTFEGNKASGYGGAIRIAETENENSFVINSKFINNRARIGGAIYTYDPDFKSPTTADTCLFKTSSDTTDNTIILLPTFNVDDFTSDYGSGENISFDLRTRISSMKVNDANITIQVFSKDGNSEVAKYTFLSGEKWTVDLPVGKYDASYSTEFDPSHPVSKSIEITLPNVNYYITVNSVTPDSKTANITAESNIPQNLFADGELIFTLPDGENITANYSDNGIWWALHTFDEVGVYQVNASYTKLDTVTVINGSVTINPDSAITLDNVTLDYGEVKNVTVETEGATGVTATINGSALTVIDNFTVQISDLAVGNYTLTVTTIPDASHLSVTKTANVVVNKVKSTLDISDIEFNYGSKGSANVTYSGAIKVVAEIINQPKAVVDVSGNKINVSGLAAGKYTLNVTTVPDDNHTAVSKTAEVTVNKINSTVTAEDVEMDYGKSVNVTATVEGATGITAKIGDNDLAVDNLTIPISGLGAGSYTLTITTVPDENHTSVNKSVNITVNKISSEIKLNNVTLDLKAKDTVSDFAQLTPDDGALNYASTNNGVAKIENGTIVAVSVGKADIIVSFDGNENYTDSKAIISVTVTPMDTRITVNQTEYLLDIDDNVTINATTVPEGLNIIYAISDPSVVKVENGVVTGLKEGNTAITLIIGDNKVYAINSTTITVSVKKIDTAIEVENKTLELKIDDESQINATLTPAGAEGIKFALSDVAIVTVDDKGNVKGIKEGTATITLSFAGNDKYAAAENVEITVIVSKIPTEINIEDEKVNLTVDETRDTGATLTPADAGNVTYTSDDESIVKVENGKLIGVSEGNAIVTVSFSGNDKYTACENKTITVTVSLNDASVSAENITLRIDDNATIVPVTSPEGLDVAYEADDSGVVKVENGVVTGLKEGTAKVTLTVGGDGKYALNSTTITVTVLKIDTSIEAVEKVEMMVGDNVTANATLSPAEAGNLEFTSTNASVVTVTDMGEITAVGEGIAIISVKFTGNDKYYAAESKNILVTVKKIPTSISADEKVAMKVGDNVTVNATLSPAEAGELEFTSGDVNVVTVNDMGEITAVGEGSTFITVKFTGNDKYAAAESKNILVTVSKIETSIEVVDKVDMKVDDNVNVNATLSPAEAGELEFTSGDVSVVTVNALGELTAVGEGKAVITVKFAGNYKYVAAESKTILVTVSKVPTSISADEKVDMKVDDKVTVNATLTPAEAGKLDFTSSNASVVTVNSLGELTAVGEGIANITVSFAGDDKYAAQSRNITVTVSKIDTSIDAVEKIDMKVGDNVAINATLTPAEAGELDYVSGDDSIVSVNSLGELTAVGKGTTIITIRFTGNDKYNPAVTKYVLVNVSKIDTSISVGDDINIKVGDYAAVNATLSPDVAGELDYTSSDVSVVSVNGIGEVNAVGEGVAVITVRFIGNDKYNAAESKNVTVTVSLNDASVSAEDITLKIDENATIVPVTSPEGLDVTYAADDSGVVKVENGVVTALKEGIAKVTLTVGGDGKYALNSTTIIVTVEKIGTSIDAVDKVEMNVGDYANVNATLTPDVAGELDYTSSDVSVVSVNGIGELTAVGDGSAIITVRFAGNDKYVAAESKYVLVTVSKIDTAISADEKVEMMVGDNVALNASLTPDVAGELDYTSSDVSVVEVNGIGQLTAVGDGSAIIIVKFAGNEKYNAAETKFVLVTVSKVDASIDVNVDKVDMKVDDKVTVNATLTPAEAGKLDFTSSNASVVTVNSLGELTAVGEGIANITVSFAGDDKYAAQSRNITVTVSKIDTSIDAVEKIDMKVGDNVAINATLTPAEAGELDYVSGDDSIVSVNSLGELTAVGKGTTIITIRFTGNDKYNPAVTKYVLVNVSKIDTSISVGDDINIKVGDYAAVNATLSPDVAGELDYTSSDVSVVSVNGIGELTAVGEGVAVITVRFIGNDKYAAAESKNVTVTVTKIDTSISVDVDDVEMKVGDNAKINANVTPAEAGELDFTSSDVSVVTVNGIGELTAVGEGTAVITVRFLGNDKYAAAESKNVAVTVSLNDASVSAEDITLKIDENATIVPVTSPEGLDVTYVADDSGVVKVENGVVTGLKEGIAKVTLTVGGDGKYALNSTTIIVTVEKIDTSIDAVDKVEMNVGDYASVNATLTPDVAGELDYTSSDVSVVTVNGIGELTAVGDGSAVIAVRFAGNDKYAAAESKYVLVTVSKSDASIDVVDKVEMMVGDNVALNASLTPDVAGELDYTSSDVSVVSVNGIGELTAVGDGSAIIIVKFAGNEKYNAAETKFVLVTVSKVDASIDVDVDKVDMKVGDNITVNATLTPAVAGELDFVSSDVSVVSVNDLGEIVAVGEGTAVVTVSFAGNEKYPAVSKNITVTVRKTVSKFAEVSIVKNNITVILSDENGNPISGANISYSVNGVSKTAVSDDKGSFVAIGEPGALMHIAYAGSDAYTPYDITIKMTPQTKSTVIVANDFSQYACDYYEGERGSNFTVQLKDVNGNILANKTVYIGYNGVTLVRTTDANGFASVQINLKNAGLYTFVVVFLGDEDYDASMAVHKIDIIKKTTSISASEKTFKSSAKTKKYTVTLKTIKGASIDGQKYLAAGKKITLELDGKTYTAKTNANGKATFNLKITKKGSFIAEISYAGDKTYEAASTFVKITIK